MDRSNGLDELLDRLVGEYSDRVQAGERPAAEPYLARVPEEHRVALARCLRTIDAGMASAPAPAFLGPGTELGGYRIAGTIGRGGMAIVYRARDSRLDRDVALKVLRPGLAVEPRFVDRFRREANAIARLQHPNILQVYEVGEERGHHFIAMELIAGPTLSSVLGELPPPAERTATDLARAVGDPSLAAADATFEQAFCALLSPVVRAIHLAHEHGLVHRDVKPSNILFHRDGRPVVADFGLAKGAGDLALTLTEESLGTPYYMSPEQIVRAREPIDGRTDVYSLGVTLYEGLTGVRPFRGDSAIEVFDAIRSATPAALRDRAPRCTIACQAVVRRAMARAAVDRYDSAAALATDLEALACGLPTTAEAGRGEFRAALQRYRRTGRLDYVSDRRLLGLPLVHLNLGGRRRGEPLRRAKGWLAVGELACGVVSFGTISLGLISFGVFALGLLACGGALAVGGASFGGGASLGGFALGGGVAAGGVAIGGLAAGWYALGGAAYGVHVVSGARQDPEARTFFAVPLAAIVGEELADAPPAPSPSEPQESPTSPSSAAGGWEIRQVALENGIDLTMHRIAGAERQTTFTLLRRGLTWDAAGRSQFAHLLEHMMIRATDPDGLMTPEGIQLNGETGATWLRLESFAPIEEWKRGIAHHAGWLAAREVDPEILAREKLVISGEEESTVRSGYTHKWASAAWWQIVGHGLSHAAVHGDVVRASAEDVRDELRAFVPEGSIVSVVTVGPIALDDVEEEARRVLGGLTIPVRSPWQAKAEVVAGDAPASLPPVLHTELARATWDLDGRQLIVWYALPLEKEHDAVTWGFAGVALNALLQGDAELRTRGILAFAEADVVTPAGRVLLLSASLPSDDDADLARVAMDRAVASVAAKDGPLSAFVSAARAETRQRPDFALIRGAMQGRSTALLEAQVVLNIVTRARSFGILRSDFAALEEVLATADEEVMRTRFGEVLVPAARHELLLRPE